jgi:hypothetical protein
VQGGLLYRHLSVSKLHESENMNAAVALNRSCRVPRRHVLRSLQPVDWGAILVYSTLQFGDKNCTRNLSDSSLHQRPEKLPRSTIFNNLIRALTPVLRICLECRPLWSTRNLSSEMSRTCSFSPISLKVRFLRLFMSQFGATNEFNLNRARIVGPDHSKG